MKSFKLLSSATLLSFSFLTPVLAAPGDLDLTFAGTGKAIVTFGGGQAKAQAAATQADGKLLLAGSAGTFNSQGGQFLIVRFDTNNALDASFGLGGKVITQMSATASAVQAVAVQGDGKILAAGYAFQNHNYNDFALARYNPNGSLDATFGTNGIVYTDFGQSAQINAIALQADGKIVVDGNLGFPGTTDAGISLARYQTNGLLDNTFGTGGVIGVPGSEYDALFGLTIEADQKILAVGRGPGAQFATYRYTTNGTTDSSFGGGSGRVLTDFGPGFRVAQANSVAIQNGLAAIGSPDKIVAAGTMSDFTSSVFKIYQLLIRYSLDGTLDSTFGHNGIVTNLVANGIVEPASVMVLGTLLDPRKITVGGSYSDGTSNYFALNSFTLAGQLDNTFGANSSGKISVPVGPVANLGDAAGFALTLQSGNYVVGGYSGFVENGYSLAAARFTSNGIVDASFANHGLLMADVAELSSPATAVAIQADGKIVAVGHNTYLTNNNVRERFILARLKSNGSPDSSFGSNGKATLNFSADSSFDDAYSVLIQPDGKIIAAGSGGSGGSFALARFKSNGAIDSSFGTNGLTTASVSGSGGQINALQLQPDGKILAGGTSGQHFALTRFSSNGIIDLSFGSGGSVISAFTAPFDFAYGMGIQADGKIALVGSALAVNGSAITSDFAAARYNTNGGVDFSFGSLGRTTGNVGGGTVDTGYAMAIQPDGKIIIAGAGGLGGVPGPVLSYQTANAFVALLRFNTNGTPDTSFGSGGSVITQVGNFSDIATSIALQPDGKILVGGASEDGFYNFFAARYTSNGVADDTYGDGGAAVVDFGTGTNEMVSGLALDSFGRAVLCGNAGGTFALARLQGDSLPGPTLKIFLTSTNTAVITWPYPSTGWSLQANTSLSGSPWSAPAQLVTNDGTNNYIIVSPSPLNGFYRLKGP